MNIHDIVEVLTVINTHFIHIIGLYFWRFCKKRMFYVRKMHDPTLHAGMY